MQFAFTDEQEQFRAAVRDLLNGNHGEAAAKLQSLIDRRLTFKDLRSYYMWASIKSNVNHSKIRFDQVPLEERNSPAYMMAKGVHYRAAGRFKKAIECFHIARVLDPAFKMASREFRSLIKELGKK